MSDLSRDKKMEAWENSRKPLLWLCVFPALVLVVPMSVLFVLLHT